jgi:hypothetical protein
MHVHVDDLLWFAGGVLFGTLNTIWVLYVVIFRPFVGKRRDERTEV